ncbi:MAG: acylneuraminate cytidylyltransferase family protein [Pseudomonadota bacterium]
MRYVAFIPLRGGSKSIPLKNIKPIGGKPLAWWTVEAALGCAAIEQVFVATDSDAIRECLAPLTTARLSVIGRSAETATDTASTESAMLEFAAAHPAEHIVLIQATSPLLTSDDLNRGIALFEQLEADSLVSVVPQKRFIWARDAEGFGQPQNYNPVKRPRRQDFSGYHVENGAFYISGREGLIRTGSRLFGRIAAHEMCEESYYELDEPSDWAVIENLMVRAAGLPA